MYDDTARLHPAPSRRHVPLISDAQRVHLNPSLREVVEYRKSGLSVNWIVGCPLDCGYCVRHLFDNFDLKTPRALTTDRAAFDALVEHSAFQRDVTPIQVLNRATDPMLPAVKPHTFAMLRMLDGAGLRNHVLVISRWRVDDEDCTELNSYRSIKITHLVTHSGISNDQIEPVDSSIAAASLRTAFRAAQSFRVVLYWRPIVPGLNDTDTHIGQAMTLSQYAHATVFTGLFYRDQIRDYYRANGLPGPYADTARRKIFPERLEKRILLVAAAGRRAGQGSPLFRKTSCAVAFAHGVADYNGHVGIRELCDICPTRQLARCERSRVVPSGEHTARMAAELGGRLIEITDRAVAVTGLDEQRRYLMQHSLGYQVHDVAKPHHAQRHGRAELGWNTTEASA